MQGMRTTTAATVVGGMLLSGLGVLATAPPAVQASGAALRSAPPAPSPIAWGQCGDPGLREAGAQCGTLVVPLDRSDPTGASVRLAVARVLHTRGPFRGAVVTNPGGPGAPGSWMAPLGAAVPRRVGLTYDWYGMDPRGTGASRPLLTCDPGYVGWDRPDYRPHGARTIRVWRQRAQGYAADCGRARNARLLDHVRTSDLAADVDALRQAIGLDAITFYGFSYGTYLAQVYATAYPEHVQALLLDGVVDPRRVFYRSNLDQDAAFQGSFRAFLGWVGRHPDAYHLGRSRAAVRQAYERVRARLVRHPAGGGRIGPDELDDALLGAAYYNGYYPYVADALSALVHRGDAAGVRALYRRSHPTGPYADNGYAMYLATECTDAPWPHRLRRWMHDSRRIDRRAPFLTWSNTWFNLPCRTWPASAAPRTTVSSAGLAGVPVLLMSETHDPATPYAGALAVRRLFPEARLVAGVGGHSHAVSLSGVACTDDAVADVLEDGSLPPRLAGDRADRRCPPLRAPEPPSGPRRAAPPAPRPWWTR